MGLSREYLIKGLNNTIVQAYHKYQVDMAVLYGADRKRAEKEMRDVLDLEFALANVSKLIIFSTEWICDIDFFLISTVDFTAKWEAKKRNRSLQPNYNQGIAKEI